MEVSRDAVRHVAGLARLALAEADLEALAADLADILGTVDHLLEAELPERPAARAPIALHPDAVLRFDPTSVRACAPVLREGLFALPRAVPPGDRDR